MVALPKFSTLAVLLLCGIGSGRECTDYYNATSFLPPRDDYRRQCIAVFPQFSYTMDEAADACSNLNNEDHKWDLPKLSFEKRLLHFHWAMVNSSKTEKAVFWIGLIRRDATNASDAVAWADPSQWIWKRSNVSLKDRLEVKTLKVARWKRYENSSEPDEPNGFQDGHACVVGEWNRNSPEESSVVWLDVPCQDESFLRDLDSSFTRLLICESIPVTKTSPPKEESMLWQYILLGVAVVVVVVCIVLAIIVFRQRRRRKKVRRKIRPGTNFFSDRSCSNSNSHSARSASSSEPDDSLHPFFRSRRKGTKTNGAKTKTVDLDRDRSEKTPGVGPKLVSKTSISVSKKSHDSLYAFFGVTPEQKMSSGWIDKKKFQKDSHAKIIPKNQLQHDSLSSATASEDSYSPGAQIPVKKSVAVGKKKSGPPKQKVVSSNPPKKVRKMQAPLQGSGLRRNG